MQIENLVYRPVFLVFFYQDTVGWLLQDSSHSLPDRYYVQS